MIPETLIADLWDVHYGTGYPADAVACHYQRDLTLAKAYAPAIFNQPDPSVSIAAFLKFADGVSRGKRENTGPDDIYVPRAWFHLFHDYHRRGLITPELWGCAARLLYVVSPPGPGNPLPGLRDALPWHLMRQDDYQLWLRLPDIVTVYRGACARSFDAAWQGVSWSTDPDHAVSYANARTTERYDTGDYDGWPRLVGATVPRAAIIGVVDGGREVFVDHERISADIVQEYAAIAPDGVDAHIARLKDIAAASYSERAAQGYAGSLGA
jgi:hypothetical protein